MEARRYEARTDRFLSKPWYVFYSVPICGICAICDRSLSLSALPLTRERMNAERSKRRHTAEQCDQEMSSAAATPPGTTASPPPPTASSIPHTSVTGSRQASAWRFAIRSHNAANAIGMTGAAIKHTASAAYVPARGQARMA